MGFGYGVKWGNLFDYGFHNFFVDNVGQIRNFETYEYFMFIIQLIMTQLTHVHNSVVYDRFFSFCIIIIKYFIRLMSCPSDLVCSYNCCTSWGTCPTFQSDCQIYFSQATVLSYGAIVGIVVGIVVLICCIAFYCRWKQRKQLQMALLARQQRVENIQILTGGGGMVQPMPMQHNAMSMGNPMGAPMGQPFG